MIRRSWMKSAQPCNAASSRARQSLESLRTLPALGLRALERMIWFPVCLWCAEPVSETGKLCPVCWSKVRFMPTFLCDVCGMPLEGGGVCLACRRHPPHFDKARAACRYEGIPRHLILAFKHSDRLSNTQILAPWAMRAAGSWLTEVDHILPMPAARQRLIARRYNQAAELLRAIIAQHPNLKARACMDMLVRTRNTKAQVSMTRTQRRANIRGAFAVPEHHKPALKGHRVLVLDDVLTSGATMNEAAKTLKRAGAHTVYGVAVCRVVPS